MPYKVTYMFEKRSIDHIIIDLTDACLIAQEEARKKSPSSARVGFIAKRIQANLEDLYLYGSEPAVEGAKKRLRKQMSPADS